MMTGVPAAFSQWARSALLALIRAYQYGLSPWLGGQCRFTPTCSHYAAGAIAAHGPWRGLGLALWRLLRCQPLARGGYDPVPPKTARIADL